MHTRHNQSHKVMDKRAYNPLEEMKGCERSFFAQIYAICKRVFISALTTEESNVKIQLVVTNQ